jgi:hypothetical protein
MGHHQVVQERRVLLPDLETHTNIRYRYSFRQLSFNMSHILQVPEMYNFETNTGENMACTQCSESGMNCFTSRSDFQIVSNPTCLFLFFPNIFNINLTLVSRLVIVLGCKLRQEIRFLGKFFWKQELKIC